MFEGNKTGNKSSLNPKQFGRKQLSYIIPYFIVKTKQNIWLLNNILRIFIQLINSISVYALCMF